MASPLTIHRAWLESILRQGIFVTPAALVEAEAFATVPGNEVLATLSHAVVEGGRFMDPEIFLFDPIGLAWPSDEAQFVKPGSGPAGEELSAAIAATEPFPSPQSRVLGALRSPEAGAGWAALVIEDRDPNMDAARLAKGAAHAAKLGRALGASVVVMFAAWTLQLVAPGPPSGWLSFPLSGLLTDDGELLGAVQMLIGERRLLSLPEEKRLPALLAASRQNRVRALELAAFTVFQHAEMTLCPGINVIIGPNGSGKSHALKTLYALCRGLASSDDLHQQVIEVGRKLIAVMRPDEESTERLVRWGAPRAEVTVRTERGDPFQLGLLAAAKERDVQMAGAWFGPRQIVYLPTREVLSLYELIMAGYAQRQLSVEETLWDACQALGLPLLREPPDALQPLLARLEQIVGGEVILRNNRFYLRTGDREVEAPLLAEGIRKLAGLARLLANGSLGPGGLLIWDEPEGSLNPVLITKAADLLVDLAKQGVQVVVASHDYLFVRHLSLLAEYKKHPDAPMRFFGFCPTPDRGVIIEQGDTLIDLDHNPILDEFTRHVEREQELVFTSDP